MAVTPFEFPPLFRKPKNVEIPKRLGVRAVVVDSSNNFLLTLQDILKPDLSLMGRKNACNKIIFPIFAFLIIAAGLYKLASYCMLTVTRSVCCVSLFLKYINGNQEIF